MSLEQEIKKARKEIVSDGYDMSVGEVINLYRDEEIFINPVFQRLFRWDSSRKTRFIESLLLGIPVPPIFVYQNEDGIWELIDGLQRLSTILEFVGILKQEAGGTEMPLVLEGTNFLPSLANRTWAGREGTEPIETSQQLQIKRARLRVEILKKESDPNAKYELFQRLNTGGIGLSEQEVRNCVAVMIDETFYSWIFSLSSKEKFLNTIDQTEYALSKQIAVELALRFLCFRHVPYQNGLDVHEYLDNAMIKVIEDETFNRVQEEDIFNLTFEYLDQALGSHAFKRWNGNTFGGKFLMSVFEVIAVGVSKEIDKLKVMNESRRNEYLRDKAQELWSNSVFNSYSGAGVRGTTRLSNLLPLADEFFA